MTERRERIALGLALLDCARLPGVPLTYEDIAAWADVSRSWVYLVEKKALRKLRSRLRFGDRETYAQLVDFLSKTGRSA